MNEEKFGSEKCHSLIHKEFFSYKSHPQKPIRICVEFVLEIFAEQSFSFLNPVQPHGRDVGTTAMITEEKPTKLSDCRVFGDEAINLLYD